MIEIEKVKKVADALEPLCRGFGQGNMPRAIAEELARVAIQAFNEANEDEIDYKTLLWKYLDHVGREEGVTFVHQKFGNDNWGGRFTDEEMETLIEIDDMPPPTGEGWGR